MPSVRNIQATSVHGRTQRAQAASILPSISAAIGKRERDREADIAEIEQRRMHREADVLQDRVEIASLGRRLRDAQERVRGHQDEQVERARDPGLHGEHVGAQRVRQVRAEQRDQRAEQREDQHPQQHRAFVIAPHAGELVDRAASPNGNSGTRSAPRNRSRRSTRSAPRTRPRRRRTARARSSRRRPSGSRHCVRAPHSGTVACTSASASASTSA